MQGFHTLDSGDILYLGEPPFPKVVDGYEQDSYHKNTYHPLWEPCRYRGQRLWRCPQGNLKTVTMCSLDESITNYVKCSGCMLLEPPVAPPTSI